MYELWTPRTHGAQDSECDKQKTPHFRTYSWRVLCDLPQTLHGDRARRAHHKRCHPFFDLIHSFPDRQQNVDFWLLGKNNTGSLPLRGILPVTNTTFSHLHRALYDLPQNLHGDRARHADPTYSFSYRVYGKIWPILPTRGFSAITP